MNWYKLAKDPIKENPNYGDIGHFRKDRDTIQDVVLWMSNLDGSNFSSLDGSDFLREALEGSDNLFSHHGLASNKGVDLGKGFIQGRYDKNRNIISLSYDPRIVTLKYLPNRLIDRLKKEFGWNVKILDYSQGPPQIVI